MKKLLVILLVLTMVLGCVACKSNTGGKDSTSPPVTSSTPGNDDPNNGKDNESDKDKKPTNENTKQNADLNNNTSNELQKVDKKDYTTVTYGKYDSYDKNEMPAGSKISAYPLDIADVLSKKSIAIKYGGLYTNEWVVVTGYVHYQKEGFFVISTSNSENIEKYVGTIIAEDKNIKTDYKWNIKDGDYITIAGLCKGTGRPSTEEYYLVLNDVFIVE